MNFRRIRTAMNHYDEIRERLTFKVVGVETNEGTVGKPATRKIWAVKPLKHGSPMNYDHHDKEADAQAECDDYNERARNFLVEEYEVVRLLLLEEANAAKRHAEAG